MTFFLSIKCLGVRLAKNELWHFVANCCCRMNMWQWQRFSKFWQMYFFQTPTIKMDSLSEWTCRFLTKHNNMWAVWLYTRSQSSSAQYIWLMIVLSYLITTPHLNMCLNSYAMNITANDLWRCVVIQVTSMAILLMVLTARESVCLYALHFDKVSQHTSTLSGWDWLNELIPGHDGRFYNEMRMHKHVFWHLLSVL